MALLRGKWHNERLHVGDVIVKLEFELAGFSNTLYGAIGQLN